MFIEITPNKLIIEATRGEWAELQASLKSTEPNRIKGELNFAIHCILQQPVLQEQKV